MGDAQSLPVVGEVVTVAESAAKITAAGALGVVGGIAKAIDGEDNPALDAASDLAKGAGNSWKEYSEKNLIVGGTIALAHKIDGNDDEADRRAGKILGALEGVADTTPGVGHVKGLVHYATGDEEHGNKCMIGATRGAAVLGAGALTGGIGGGFVAGGLVGSGTGVVYDGTHSLIDMAVNEDTNRTHGVFKPIQEIVEDDDYSKLKDAAILVGGDFYSGGSAARSVANSRRNNSN